MSTIIQELCYILMLIIGDEIFLKIGEKEDGQNRIEKLLEEYRIVGYNPICLHTGILLPHNKKKRLTDATVRKHLDKSKFKKVSKEHMNALKIYDGDTEFVRLKDGVKLSDEEICAEVVAVIESLSKDEANFTKKCKVEDDVDMKGSEKDPWHKHMVKNGLLYQLHRKVPTLYDNTKMNVLFIGQFDPEWISSVAGYNNIYILYDSENTKYSFLTFLQTNIHTATTTKELFKMCKKFDYIIANPPYAIGNDITAKVRESCTFKQYINLMPVSKYKGDKLFKYVADIEKAEDKFEDATVGDCLAVAGLSECETGKFETWDDFSLVTYDEKFRKFYEENRKRKLTFKAGAYCSHPEKKLEEYNSETDFFTYIRVCADGVDMSGDTYNWNNGISPDINRLVRHYNDRGYMTVGEFLYFNTKIEKDNITDFWYKNGRNGLIHKFIKGLNKHSGDCLIAIPRVDWSRSWTDREILADYGYTEEEINEILEV